MPTSTQSPDRSSGASEQGSTAGPLRLALAEGDATRHLDGAWWPHSRDLATELADLVDHFPPACGRVARVLVSPPDWQPWPRRVPVGRGYVKVGSFPHDDTHVVDVRTSDRTSLRILVIPPDTPDEEAAAASAAASSPGNARSGTEVLQAVAEAGDHWHEEGTSWWHPHPVAPSYRTDADQAPTR